tara:strand:- start:350 stop:1012 length:663 start_codon:yes stop_codon:yes gene_type:complete
VPDKVGMVFPKCEDKGALRELAIKGIASMAVVRRRIVKILCLLMSGKMLGCLARDIFYADDEKKNKALYFFVGGVVVTHLWIREVMGLLAVASRDMSEIEDKMKVSGMLDSFLTQYTEYADERTRDSRKTHERTKTSRKTCERTNALSKAQDNLGKFLMMVIKESKEENNHLSLSRSFENKFKVKIAEKNKKDVEELKRVTLTSEDFKHILGKCLEELYR